MRYESDLRQATKDLERAARHGKTSVEYLAALNRYLEISQKWNAEIQRQLRGKTQRIATQRNECLIISINGELKNE